MIDDLDKRWGCVQDLHFKLGQSQPQIARGAGVHQSTVSRILTQRPERDGPAFRKLCIYAIKHEGSRPMCDPAGNTTLMTALRDVWDGSQQHADALAAIIMAVQRATRVTNR